METFHLCYVKYQGRDIWSVIGLYTVTWDNTHESIVVLCIFKLILWLTWIKKQRNLDMYILHKNNKHRSNHFSWLLIYHQLVSSQTGRDWAITKYVYRKQQWIHVVICTMKLRQHWSLVWQRSVSVLLSLSYKFVKNFVYMYIHHK